MESRGRRVRTWRWATPCSRLAAKVPTSLRRMGAGISTISPASAPSSWGTTTPACARRSSRRSIWASSTGPRRSTRSSSLGVWWTWCPPPSWCASPIRARKPRWLPFVWRERTRSGRRSSCCSTMRRGRCGWPSRPRAPTLLLRGCWRAWRAPASNLPMSTSSCTAPHV